VQLSAELGGACGVLRAMPAICRETVEVQLRPQLF